MFDMLKAFFKKKSGFTLVELLAVVVVLGIILAIAIPSITSIIRSAKVSAFNATEEMVEEATRTYLVKTGTIIEDEPLIIPLESLIEEGVLEEVLGPDGEVCTGTVTIYESNEELVYDSCLTCGESYVSQGTPFITRWNTANVLSNNLTGNTSIKFPISYDLGTYDFVIYWGDGSSSEITSFDDAELVHDYGVEGIYDVTVVGTIEGFGFRLANTDNSKLVDVLQWGNVKLRPDGYQFMECRELTGFSAVDELDTSNVTSLYASFYRAFKFDADINYWDVSNVTTMMNAFSYASVFNHDLDEWNTSNVEIMQGTFWGALAFNGDVSTWNTSKVSTMEDMFNTARAFNSPINDWDVSSVEIMDSMFRDAWAFNQDLDNWSIDSLTDIDYMFYRAKAFNGNVSTWDTSSVQRMTQVFAYTENFNSDITSWNVASSTTVSGMFFSSLVFNQDISGWEYDTTCTSYSSFLNSAPLFSQANYDALIIGLAAAPSLARNVTFGASSVCNSAASATEKQYLIDTYAWSFSDGCP